MKKIFFCGAGILSTVLLIFLSLGSGIAEGRGRDWDDRSAWDEEYLKSSLLDLKADVQKLQQANRLLLEKMNRFEARVPQLQQELRAVEQQKDSLLQEGQNMQEVLAAEKIETEVIKTEVSEMEQSIEQFNGGNSDIHARISQKQARQYDLQREADRLQEEIAQIKEKLSSANESPKAAWDEKNIKLNQLYENKSQRLRERSEELSRVKASFLESQQAQEAMAQQNNVLQNQLTEANQELQQLAEELKEFEAAGEGQEKAQLDQLNTDIEELTQRQDSLLSVLEEQKPLQVNINQFEAKKKEFLDTIQSLQKENQQLQYQKQLLEETWQKGQKVSGSEGAAATVEVLNQQIAQQGEEQTQLKNEIAQKKDEFFSTEKIYEDFKKEIPQLRKSLDAEKEKTSRLRQGELARYNRLIAEHQQKLKKANEETVLLKDPSWGQREIKRMEGEKERLNKHLAMVQGELQTVVDEGMKMAEVSYAPENVAQLDAGIQQRQVYAREQQAMLATVKKNFIINGLSRGQFQTEERQLKEHWDTLKNEHQHLQTEVLSLMVQHDRLLKK
ncbi:MAG: hypothetical protein A2787_06875 [Omnitrophica WOR_2 bacterium RIFCSPHIGHO2_01_FULL_48_9]|nr:MAG: hypothetical protein A2787_06875 [Omnitrophica WOR_2 bacterium RIFCSPHIGHO2_01_FULL_48_9]